MLNLIYATGTRGGHFLFRTKGSIRRRHVSSLAELGSSMMERQWDIIFIAGSLPYSRAISPTCATLGQLCHMLSDPYQRSVDAGISLPFELVILDGDWEGISIVSKHLTKAGVPWVWTSESKVRTWCNMWDYDFTKYTPKNKKGDEDVSVCAEDPS